MDERDPRQEWLVIFGLLAVGAGAAFVVVAYLINFRMPNVPATLALSAIGGALIVGGVWLARRRRWAGLLVAGISLLVAVVYLLALTDCDGCGAIALSVNVVIALVYGTPGVLILRWRRFLR